MSSEQQFDKIIRNKVNGGENDFPFNEADWDKARRMIDAERGSSVITAKSVSIAIVLMLLIGSGILVSLNFIGNDKAVVSEALTKKSEQSSNAGIVESAKSVNHVQSSAETEKVNDAAAWDNNNDVKTSSLNENSAVVNNKSSATSVSASSGYSRQMAILSKKGNKGNKGTERSSKHVSSGAYKHGSKQLTLSPVIKPQALVAQSNSASEYDVYENNENAFWLAGKITSLPKSKLDSALVKTPFDFIRVYDVDYYKTKRRKTHYINIEGGMAYLMGWNAPKGKDAKGFNAYAGINLGFYIGKKASISTGVQAYNIGNIQQPFFNGSNVSYDFGANGTYTVISGKSLYYAAIPFNFNYSLKGSDRVSLGVNAGILWGGVNTEETFVMQDGVKMNSQTIRTLGYYEGMNPVNMMLTAGYGRNVSKRLRLNAELLYGLSDIFKSTRFNDTREQIPGIRIGAQYTLADR